MSFSTSFNGDTPPSQFWRLKEGEWQQDDLSWVATFISPELISCAQRLHHLLFYTDGRVHAFPHVVQIQHYKFIWS